MRIGVNLLYLIPSIVGGTETYAEGLLHGLATSDPENEYLVFVNQESADWPIPDAANFSRVVCPIRARNQFRRYFYEQFRFPFLIRKHKLDLLHSLGYVAPLFLPCKSVVSILDILYDYPGPALKKLVLRVLLKLVAHRADHIITISLHSKKQISTRFHVDESRVTKTYLGPKNRGGMSAAKKGSQPSNIVLPEIYVLAFSSLCESKNIPRLLQAFAVLGAHIPSQVELVLVGHIPERGRSLKDLARDLHLEKRVVFTGYLPDRDVSIVLQHASAFVFPSLYEGFGMPILEAMAAGIPVASSNAASLPEVCGNAALMFNPLEVNEIAGAIRRLISDHLLRDELVERGFRNVSRFSWLATAKETLGVYSSFGDTLSKR